MPIFHTARNVAIKSNDNITVIDNYSAQIPYILKKEDSAQNNPQFEENCKRVIPQNMNSSTNNSKLIVVDADFNDLDSISYDENDSSEPNKFIINSDIIDKLNNYEKRVNSNGKKYYSIDLLKKLAINSNRLYKQPCEPSYLSTKKEDCDGERAQIKNKPIINPMIKILKKQRQKQEISNLQQEPIPKYITSSRPPKKYGFIKTRHSSIKPYEIHSLQKRTLEFIKDKQQELQEHQISGRSPFANKAIILFRRESAKELYYKIYNQHKVRWAKQNREKHEIYKNNSQVKQQYKKMLESEASNGSLKNASNTIDHIKLKEKHFELPGGKQSETSIKSLPSIIPIARILESSI